MNFISKLKKKEKYQKVYYIILAVVYLVLFSVGILITFRFIDISKNQKEGSRLIGASYMTMNNEFYRIIHEQVRVRVEAEGDRVILRDSGMDVQRQKEQIREMMKMGIEALILTPVDPDGLVDVLIEARAKGIFVIVVDSNVSTENLINCTIVSDNYNAGCLDGEYMLKTQKEGKIVVMAHNSAVSGRQRVAGFLNTVSKNPEYTLESQLDCNGQYEKALSQMREYLNEGHEFDTVFCLNDPTAEGVVAALKEKGLAGNVNIYGVDASPDAKALISAGMMKASVVQFPTKIGETAADVLYNLIAGNKIEKNITVPVDIVTQDNINQYEKDRWQ
ncbi:sugar ABC transporter substrate-binding protein [Butyrivibrio sp. AC2005]|uniref:sugar ABC transporter substrate-binding protein n=1 Tax=Butyrivibrio sp. AC2005 TaxID=1280672 RepID=UPI0003FD422A|nr:sugar ABC transporter substrate-binding protein [Butyrivibrio sp. AC2005]